MIVFDSEDAAQAGGERVRSMIPDLVKLEQVEVLEVVEHAWPRTTRARHS